MMHLLESKSLGSFLIVHQVLADMLETESHSGQTKFQIVER